MDVYRVGRADIQQSNIEIVEGAKGICKAVPK